ncbi:MAG: HAD-IC family P-type ATPase [Patescibacteria group bacterium]
MAHLAPNLTEPLWHVLSLTKIFKLLETSPQGLKPEAATLRLSRFGPNELPSTPQTPLYKILIRQFSGVLINILVVAAVITFLLGEHTDAGVILAAVVINVVVGFFQERKAEKALSELKKIVSYQAKVIRSGEERTILASQLAVGDVIELQDGDRVPADAHLITAYNLETNEAVLTGESAPLTKQVKELLPGTVIAERLNMVYMGTSVVAGGARAVVVATGLGTEMGKIAKLLTETKREATPLQKKLSHLGRLISLVVLSSCLIIFLFGILLGFAPVQMFTTAIAIAVAAVPEGMVVAVTVILALGMRRILKKQALVRELLAAETLGSTTVICTDKTGTLTTGEMQVAWLYTEDQESESQLAKIQDGSSALALLKVGVLASDAYIENPHDELTNWRVIGNPTERALVLAGVQAGIPIVELRHQYKRLDEIPFSSSTKYMMTLHQIPKSEHELYLKGAPEIVLEFCNFYHTHGKQHHLSALTRKKIAKKIEQSSSQGLRLLALASRKINKKFTQISKISDWQSQFSFLGFVGIKDPLREGVKQTLEQARAAGIKVVMITGDHKRTAQAIARELGMPAEPENILDGQELASLDDAALRQRIYGITVFARTTPHDKPRIVDAWQSHGEVVAMTGDGVNDAPALKSSDIGVALGSGSDVAKETADIVLLDNNFKTIVSAVEEGRVIFHNIRKLVLYLMSDGFSEMVLVFGSFIIGALLVREIPLPILATQILWINLVTDSFPALTFTIDPTGSEIMTEKPIKLTEPILNFQRKFLIGFMSVIRGLGALFLFLYMLRITDSPEHARTIIFTMMVVSSLLYAISCKQLKYHFWHKRSWNNRYLVMAIVAAFLLQLVAIYTPFFQQVLHTTALKFFDWLLIISVAGLLVILVEAVKHFFMRSSLKTE